MDGLPWMVAYRWEQNLKDVGDQALMRGLDTAFPRCVRGCPDLTAGVGAWPATKRLTGISPAVVPPPPVRKRERSYLSVGRFRTLSDLAPGLNKWSEMVPSTWPLPAPVPHLA